MNFKTIRITLLLLILAYVGADQFLTNSRTTDWKNPLRVVIFPINADSSKQADRYISTLKVEDFADISEQLRKEASRYNVKISTPMQIDLAKPLKSRPPLPPVNGSILSIMRWSLSLRYWSWKEDTPENYAGIAPHIRAYVLYYDPNSHKVLHHSTGLKNGKIALINLFANKRNAKQNNIVVFHELLHTLGATDKYQLSSGQPIYPEGYAEPEKSPLYPQIIAEIMGGKLAISESKTITPESLAKTLIGPKTAHEIGW